MTQPRFNLKHDLLITVLSLKERIRPCPLSPGSLESNRGDTYTPLTKLVDRGYKSMQTVFQK